MRLVLVAAATCLLLAGCSQGPAPAAEAAADPEPPAGPVQFELATDLMLNRVSLHRGPAVGFGLPGDANCVWLRRVPVAQEFTVTATWDAQTPAWERLEMTIQHDGGQEFAAGPSPLTITADGLRRDSFFEGIGTILQPEVPGPVLDQPVHVEISLLADVGAGEPELEPSGCTWGRIA